MRFLFISRRGASLSLAKRIAEEGNIVNFFVYNSLYKVLGNGIVTKTKIDEFKNSNVVIFDEVGLGNYASEIDKKNKITLGTSKFSDLFNEDLEYKKSVLERCNLKLSDNKDGENETIELYTTAWFNGFSYIKPVHSYFKKTKFMERDLSIDTDCSGCLLFYHKSNKITKTFLNPLLKELKKTGYIGAVNIKSSITKDKLSLKDICLSFTYDNTYAALEGLRQPLGEFLFRFGSGVIKKIKASEDFLVSVRVSIPPYPFETSEKYKILTVIEGINSENLKHIWLRDVQNENGVYKSANCDGYLLSVSARGLTPYQAFKRTYRTINNLRINNIQYRSDLCDGLEDKYNKLKEWNYF
jgi:hypothetical protein